MLAFAITAIVLAIDILIFKNHVTLTAIIALNLVMGVLLGEKK